MSNLRLFKPRQQAIYIYGVGVVKREEFTEKHFLKCVEHAKKCNLDVDHYIQTRFELQGFKDIPLFESTAEPESPVEVESDTETEVPTEEKPKGKPGKKKKVEETESE